MWRWKIIIRSERLGKVFITAKVLLFLTFVLHFVWSWRGQGITLAWQCVLQTLQPCLVDAWLLPDVWPASAFLTWYNLITHLIVTQPHLCWTLNSPHASGQQFILMPSHHRFSCQSLGARLQSYQADLHWLSFSLEWHMRSKVICSCVSQIRF